MFISDLYYGNIDAMEQAGSNRHAEADALQKLCDAEKALMTQLSDDMKKQISAYTHAADLFCCESRQSAFEVGFRLGARCIMDVLSTDI